MLKSICSLVFVSRSVKRRFYKNWYRSKKKAFDRYARRVADESNKVI